MTDEEYEELARRLGLASPKALYANAQDVGPAIASLSSDPSASLAVSGAPQAGAVPVGTDISRAQGLTTPDLTNIAAPTQISVAPSGVIKVATPTEATFIGAGKGTPADLNKAIDDSIKYHSERYSEQQSSIADALKTLQDIDATDEQKNKAQYIAQGGETGKLAPPFGYNDDGSARTLSDLDALLPGGMNKSDRAGALKQLQRNAYVATISPQLTPQEQQLQQYANLQTGPSWRALQDLGIQYPGVTGKYATAPVFQPAAPGPAQRIQRAQPVPGQTIDPTTGKVVQAPASNIGLTTVRGTEFGEVDNPARGGYTEAGWDVGARGAKLSGTDTQGVALPFSVLSQYGKTSDKDFIDNFNGRYDIQVIDSKTGKAVTAPLVDYGPGAKTGAGLDMLWGTRNNLGLPVNYSGNISYRIVPKGSAMPDNTTPSVQQTAQTAQNQSVASGQFAQGANPNEVYIQQIDRRGVRDPSVYGKVMGNDEILKYVRAQTDDYASAMDSAGTPINTKQYQDIFQKFYEGAQKYQDAKEEVKPPPQDYNDQFASLSALVSPTAATSPDGKPMSQIDLLQDLHSRLLKEGPGLVGMKSDAAREFDAQTGHLVANVARGLFGQKGNLSESEQKGAAEGIPTYWDSEKSAEFKTNLLRSAIRDKMRQIINFSKAQHYDTGAMEQEYRRIYGLDKAASDAAFTSKADTTSSKFAKQNQSAQPQPNQSTQPSIRAQPDQQTLSPDLNLTYQLFGGT